MTTKQTIKGLDREGWTAKQIAETMAVPLEEVRAELGEGDSCEHGTAPADECRECIADSEATIYAESRGPVERPCLFEGDHGGLRVLENLNIRTIRATLGENGALELISNLVSKMAFSEEAALKIVQDSGLL